MKNNTKLARLDVDKARSLGWRVLAGGFVADDAEDVAMAEQMVNHITVTGGRAALVDAGDNLLEVHRPGAEMETTEQTEERLQRTLVNQQSAVSTQQS